MLDALRARLAQDLDWLGLPAPAWTPELTYDGQPVTDVLVVGAGMCGLTAAASLTMLGIRRIRIVDKAPAGQEGPWVTFARMETLRSPKELTGPCLGLPALTFRAWYEAQFGLDAWRALDKIPRTMWMDYLVWYREVLDLQVENGVTVLAVEPLSASAQEAVADAIPRHDAEPAAGAQPLLAVTLQTHRGTEQLVVRHLVLATGRDGGGRPQIPEMARQINRRFWAHSADPINFAALRGKRVAVIGAGASAMDNAATALEEGAARLDMFIRRKDLPRINKMTGISSPGSTHGFATLPDQWKWRFNHYSMTSQTPPPRASTLRVSRHSNAYFHLGSPVQGIVERDDGLSVKTPHGEYEVDFLIFGTGFTTDVMKRPELASVASQIKLWKDVYQPDDTQTNRELGDSPYLAPGFALQEKRPGALPALTYIHLFNYSAFASQGKLSGDIPAVSVGAKRMAESIASRIFTDDRAYNFAQLQAYAKPELFGDEWVNVDADKM